MTRVLEDYCAWKSVKKWEKSLILLDRDNLWGGHTQRKCPKPENPLEKKRKKKVDSFDFLHEKRCKKICCLGNFHLCLKLLTHCTRSSCFLCISQFPNNDTFSSSKNFHFHFSFFIYFHFISEKNKSTDLKKPCKKCNNHF